MSRLFEAQSIGDFRDHLGEMFLEQMAGVWVDDRELTVAEVHNDMYDHYNSWSGVPRTGLPVQHPLSLLNLARRLIWDTTDSITDSSFYCTVYRPPKELVRCPTAVQMYLPPLNPLLSIEIIGDKVRSMHLDVVLQHTAEMYKCLCDPVFRFNYGCRCYLEHQSGNLEPSTIPWFGGA